MERSSERGFTLFEVVMAVVILGVVGLPLALMFANASWRSGDGYLISTATFLAQEKAEQIMADRSSPGRGFDYVVSGNYPAEDPVSGYDGFSRSVTVASDSTYSSVTYRTVTVTVSNAAISDVTATLWVTDY
jgi:prepilin-type N-terminal cleavage/methylation domain-containing protein